MLRPPSPSTMIRACRRACSRGTPRRTPPSFATSARRRASTPRDGRPMAATSMRATSTLATTMLPRRRAGPAVAARVALGRPAWARRGAAVGVALIAALTARRVMAPLAPPGEVTHRPDDLTGPALGASPGRLALAVVRHPARCPPVVPPLGRVPTGRPAPGALSVAAGPSVINVGRKAPADRDVAVYAAPGPSAPPMAVKARNGPMGHAPTPAVNALMARGRLDAAPVRATRARGRAAGLVARLVLADDAHVPLARAPPRRVRPAARPGPRLSGPSSWVRRVGVVVVDGRREAQVAGDLVDAVGASNPAAAAPAGPPRPLHPPAGAVNVCMYFFFASCITCLNKPPWTDRAAPTSSSSGNSSSGANKSATSSPIRGPTYGTRRASCGGSRSSLARNR